MRNLMFSEGYLGQSVKNAVVTVPAYFNDSQRQASVLWYQCEFSMNLQSIVSLFTLRLYVALTDYNAVKAM